MSGVPGAGGPVPKRSTERRRRNKDTAPDVVRVPVAVAVEAPPLPDATAPLAREWYESLQRSGQAQFYEPSDWAAAQFVAATMTRFLKQRVSAQLFAAVWAAMGELLTTEGARRRVRLEIERPPAETAERPGVTALNDYRARLTKGGRRG